MSQRLGVRRKSIRMSLQSEAGTTLAPQRRVDRGLKSFALNKRDKMNAKRILILGGGFGGVYTARHLEQFLKHQSDVEIVLVSRDNFLLMTPLLFEVFSG